MLAPQEDDARGRMAAQPWAADRRRRREPRQADEDSAETERLRRIFAASSLAMHVTDGEEQIVEANPAFERMLGYTESGVRGVALAAIVHPDDWEVLELLYRNQHEGAPERFLPEARYLHRDGRAIWVRVRVSWLQDSPSGGPFCLGTVEDISEVRRFERQLRYNATHDDLTGLPNRTLMQERLQRLAHSPGNGHAPFALLLIGLERIRAIGDAFGARYGDAIVQEFGTRLRGVMSADTTVGRVDGDEFAVVVPGAYAAGAADIADTILSALTLPFDLGGQSLDVDVGIGIALFPDHGRDSKSLLERAAIALHDTHDRATPVVMFNAEQEARSRRRMSLASDLRAGIDRGQLMLHYQPKVDFTSGTVVGVEALVRWQHPVYGLVQPAEFIPLAEDTGAIKRLTLWVLDDALRQCRRWRECGLSLRMVVNLSARNLHDYRLSEMVSSALTAAGLEPACLGLEITESAVMADPHRALTILTGLSEMGIEISIDDFGTGYSSFAYLDQLPAREIKIDRSFVQDMVRNDSHFRIVHGTIDIGHDLGLRTVAEGVEDRQTMDALATLGCDVGQGFYLSRPVPGEQLGDWLANRVAGPPTG